MHTVGKKPNLRPGETKPGNDRPVLRSAPSPASSAAAAYIADMCGQLAILAKKSDLPLIAHFLSMAQAEAMHALD